MFNASGSDRKQILQNISDEVQRQRDRCLTKRRKIKGSNGRDLVVRDLCAKTLKWISRFSQVGDVGANFDPGHASLPWAGLRFLLQVSWYEQAN